MALVGGTQMLGGLEEAWGQDKEAAEDGTV